MNLNKKRVIGALILVVGWVACLYIAPLLSNTTSTNTVVGSFGSIVFALIALKLVKADDILYFCTLIFVFMASPLGSVLDFYRKIDMYDKVVHFGSGILIACFGMLLAKWFIQRFDDIKVLPIFTMILIACLFSSGAAGVWEILEYCADNLAGGTMQRGMVDTVTDMIAGNAGALCYGIFMIIMNRKKF